MTLRRIDRGLTALLVCCGLGISVATYAHLDRLERRASEVQFEVAAQDKVALLEHAITRSVDAAMSMADLVRIRPDVSPEEFDRFGRLLLERQPNLTSLGYSWWVPPGGEDLVLRRLREEGVPLTHITVQRAPDLPYEPAPPTAEGRLVLARLSPASLAPEAIGSDVASRPRRRQTILRARDDGEARMTGLLQLAGRAPEEAGVLVFVPVYRGAEVPGTVEERREAFAGAVSIGLVLGPVLREVLGEHLNGQVRAVVMDRDDGPGSRVIFDSGMPDGAGLETDPEVLAADPSAVWRTVEAGGRSWEVLSTPGPGFPSRSGWARAPILALVLGSVITFLVAVVMSLLVRHGRTMQRNLAEREAAAAELSRVNAALETANQDMEEFVMAVSHDLKTPLQAIGGVGELLEVGVERGDVSLVRGGVETLNRSTQAMKRIVDDLLEHSRAGWAPMAWEPVDLGELAERLAAEHARSAGPGAPRLEIGSMPTIHGDPGRLAAALSNLIDNAFKYGCSRPQERDPLIRLGSSVVDDEIRVFVSDNGIGIPEEDRAGVFKLFKRLGAGGQGTGIGLAIVHRVLRAHGGRVWVEDTPGGGATFVMAFPRTPPPRTFSENWTSRA
jgi:signal transduction histidine kinase